jgi:hypothetical protein
MKLKNFLFGLILSFFGTTLLAQDRTTVTATSTDISDNLDLRAVASIFGESRDLEDFERRLNDPDAQISNLDLNGDGQVDYLRVIEKTEQGIHVIVIQAVLDRDIYQDIATVDVERSGNNPVQVQVVGDPYIYGPNYIYEPVYVVRPVIFDVFWIPGYLPYYSSWYWGYYPSYWHYWHPFPIYHYRTHVHSYINVHNNYHYVNAPRNPRAVAISAGIRANGYERLHPGRSFSQRNNNVENLHQLHVVRRNETRSNAVRNGNVRQGNVGTPRVNDAGVRNAQQNASAPRSNAVRSNESTRTKLAPSQLDNAPRPVRSQTETQAAPRSASPRIESVETPRTVRAESPRVQSPVSESPRVQSPRAEAPRMEAPRQSAPRIEAPRISSPQPRQMENRGGRGGRR